MSNRPDHHKKQWYWIATGSEARGVMMTLFLLVNERRQSQIRHSLSQNPELSKPGPDPH